MELSPYTNQPISNWSSITASLIEKYPVPLTEILEIANLSWSRLWSSVVGGEIKINEVELPATVVGYFFQKLFSHELSRRYPNEWQGEKHKNDKDLVNIKKPDYSTEMKASGQLGYALFGNRSYNQTSESSRESGKNKSGFYITLNFHGQTMTLLRIGWIDQADWIPQGSQTGQAAVLKPEVYDHKLIIIKGDYIKESPIQLLPGIGPKTAQHFHSHGVRNFHELKFYKGSDRIILNTKLAQQNYLTAF
ncbi:hypothetical protein CBP31_05930 [Oceanisphaera profunda]|uniref:Uncharacterized protein n=1 Tax=Oceanisphaera profunda TaxID=1416627 RepID=A0A1Y0D3X0_9GAMM|nr:ScaI family restriction endonuclease [Oceanisphaera profunda]ART82223.1 hypothetical protein CBP31_05930 [Oceanisphaera profunda]